jgi:hypothetical protein
MNTPITHWAIRIRSRASSESDSCGRTRRRLEDWEKDRRQRGDFSLEVSTSRAVWRRYPLLGSTFENSNRVVMGQIPWCIETAWDCG